MSILIEFFLIPAEYMEINVRLRQGEPTRESESIRFLMEQAYDSNPVRATFRGTVMPGDVFFSSIEKGLGKDKIVIDKAFMSSSDDLEVALDFLIPPNPKEQEVVFQFVTRDYIDLRSISEWEEESEFLINSGSEMYIKKIIPGKICA